uniref:Uncharacterized protein n=1 Tax=Oryza meridionalis TaxID=40149 RepID=A0A0E0ET07_9ORYZ
MPEQAVTEVGGVDSPGGEVGGVARAAASWEVWAEARSSVSVRAEVWTLVTAREDAWTPIVMRVAEYSTAATSETWTPVATRAEARSSVAMRGGGVDSRDGAMAGGEPMRRQPLAGDGFFYGAVMGVSRKREREIVEQYVVTTVFATLLLVGDGRWPRLQ